MSQLDYAAPALRPADADPYAFAKLCAMMFLQFFVWGAWYVTTSNYMAARGMGATYVAWAYSVSPIAAIISPFFLGMVADRFFASERVLAVLHLVGAVAIAAAPVLADRSGALFIFALLLHMLCYMPTIGLTNSISFANLSNQEKQFPFVRVWGTLGWIAANLVVSFGLKADTTAGQYYAAAAAGVVLAGFCLALPHTPPPARGKRVTAREVLGLDALAMLRRRSYAVFIVCAFLICIPLATYYAAANLFVGAVGVQRVAAVMSVGQAAEVVFMFLMPLFFAWLGVRWMLAIGMLAWVARYALFAAAAPSASLPLIVLGIALHGLCYDFFFVTGFIYTEKRSTPEIRNQAQGFLVLMTYGLGMLIGAQLSGYALGKTVTATGAEVLRQWATFWWMPCVFAGVVLLFFLALFRDDTTEAPAEVAADLRPAPTAAEAGIGH